MGTIITSRKAKPQTGKPGSPHPPTAADAGGGSRGAMGGTRNSRAQSPLPSLSHHRGGSLRLRHPGQPGMGHPPPWKIRGIFHNGGNTTPLRSQRCWYCKRTQKLALKSNTHLPKTLHYSAIYWKTIEIERPLLIKLLNC